MKKPIYFIAIFLYSFLVLYGIGFRDPTPVETALSSADVHFILNNLFHGMHPPVYFFAILFYKYIFGSSVFSLRLLSYFIGILNIFLFFNILKTLKINKKWLFLLIFNPFFIFFSREGGYYIFHLLCAQAIFISYIYYIKKDKILPLIITMVVSFYSYYYHLFLIICLFIYSLYSKKSIRPFIIFFIFSIPLLCLILFNPFIGGILNGSSTGLTASKPPIFAFPKIRVSEYLLFFPSYVFFEQSRYLRLSLWLAIPFSIFIFLILYFKKTNKRKWGIMFLECAFLLSIFSLITQSRIYRFSFFPHHLFPFYPFLLIGISDVFKSKGRDIFIIFILNIMLFQDYGLVFNELGPFYNKNEVPKIISYINGHDYMSKDDLIYCNYSYEWCVSSLSDTFKNMNPGMDFISMEDYFHKGKDIWKDRKRVFEIKPTNIKILIKDDRFKDDFYYKKIKIMNKAEEELEKEFYKEKRLLFFGETGSKFELIVWERGKKAKR